VKAQEKHEGLCHISFVPAGSGRKNRASLSKLKVITAEGVAITPSCVSTPPQIDRVKSFKTLLNNSSTCSKNVSHLQEFDKENNRGSQNLPDQIQDELSRAFCSEIAF
jgi:hypothetical protein